MKKSTSQSAFFNLRVLIGLLIILAGVFVAFFATSATGGTRHGEVNPFRLGFDPSTAGSAQIKGPEHTVNPMSPRGSAQEEWVARYNGGYGFDIAYAIALDCSGNHEGKSYDITGPEALTMTEIAERISAAIGRTIRYVNVSVAERRQALLAAGLPADFVDALDEQAVERLKHPESRVYLGTHEALGIKPTTFAEFARRNAAAFRGEAVPS